MMKKELNGTKLAITETHLDSSLYDAEISMEGLQLSRADRDLWKNGGVALYLRTDIAAETIELSKGSNGYIENLMLHIKKCNLAAAIVHSPLGTDHFFFVVIKIWRKWSGEPI